MSSLSLPQLDALLAEATVDCYDEDEQLTGRRIRRPTAHSGSRRTGTGADDA
ncbi:hypothetical protein ABT297_16570 [Dactylosporangium sp. NPDC000555]|uniref:hypothetical protein n=1 Tax=Dactylosporangium sp. NPDC000555 TaxID=3154260 RepID=UPI003326BA64